jgi:protein phosphatase
MQQLIFLIGISGSGKSTYIKSHFIPEIIVSPDELRKKLSGDVNDQSQNGKIWGMVPGLLKQKMEQYGKAVLDATNVDMGDRAAILKQIAKRGEVERIAIIFNTNPEESKRRIHKDLEAGKDRSSVPPEIIDKQYIKFKRGFNSISQQFDKIIDGNKGRSEMEESYIKLKDLIK